MPVARAKPPAKQNTSHPAGLYLIGIYKLLEGTLLVAAGIGAIRLLHRDVQTVFLHWVHVLRIDPDNHYIHTLLSRAFSISHRQLKEISAGTFIYAGLRYAEGVGLILRKRWAEYFTVILTGIFIPLEVWEIYLHVTAIKLVVFAFNIATLWYLLWSIHRGRRSK